MAKKILQNYPGAKTNSGIIPFLVNNIPYHERYFELFAGSAQLFRHKRRARVNYLNDINGLVIAELFCTFGHEQETIRYSTLELKQVLPFHSFTRRDFLYLDPPYPAAARRSGAVIYDHEMLSDELHNEFLFSVLDVDANIMISSRPNELYDRVLLEEHGWHSAEFETMGHRGKVTEVIYMNYQKPALLHQYDMLGDDCWERQAMDRMSKRFAEKLRRVDNYTRHIMIQELVKNDPAAVQHFLSVRQCDAGK